MNKTTNKSHKQFMDLFRKFYTVEDGVEYICKALGVRPVTVMTWRCRTRHVIPHKKLARLIDHIERNPPAEMI